MLTTSTNHNSYVHAAMTPKDRVESMGRALLLRAGMPLDERSTLCKTDAHEIARRARQEHSRVVVLDTYPAAYADSDGLRWLLCLSSELGEEGIPLHIVSRPQSAVRRNLDWLRAGLSQYDTVQDALKPSA